MKPQTIEEMIEAEAAILYPYDKPNTVFERRYNSIQDIKRQAYIAGRSKGIEEQLLNFCHWLGERGYKINGYDDSQLLALISQFKRTTS